MAIALIGPTPPTPNVTLMNHHKMLRLRRLSDMLIEAKAKPHSFNRSVEIQMIHKQRKVIMASMPPLRLTYVSPINQFKVNT